LTLNMLTPENLLYSRAMARREEQRRIGDRKQFVLA
jgi:hypothetical protein